MVELSRPQIESLGAGALCVGREAELATLHNLYERAAREAGQSILVSGATGVGKSRLLQEFKRRSRLAGVCVLEGRCRADGSAYQPFIEIVREASSYLADLAPALFQTSRSLEILDTLSGIAEDEEPFRSERWEDRRIALYESVGDLLLSVARVCPPLLIIHDLQLADDASRGLLRQLLHMLAGNSLLRGPEHRGHFKGLFLLSERSAEEPTDNREDLFSGVAHTYLPLQGLDRAGVEAFLSSPSVVSRFVEATQGNPRQIEALLHRRSSDPDQILMDRIGALPEKAASMISALAVLGRPASPRTLARIADLRPAGLARETESILQAEILTSSVHEGDLHLSFGCTADQDAVLERLGAEQRARLHRRVGEELLRAGDEMGAAEHLLRSEAPDLATEVALQAGERLEIAFAYERAVDLYERALDNAPEETPVRHELEERLCDLLDLTGEYGRALELTERLAARSPGDDRLLRRMGHLHLQQGDFSRARAKLENALGLMADRNEEPEECALVRCDLAEVYFLQGDHARAVDTADAALAEANHRAPLPAIKARNTLGKILLERGQLQEAADLFQSNLEASRSANVAPEESRALINLGIAHLRQGRYREAAECYRDGLSAAEVSHDYRHRALCLQNLGVLAHWRRDYTSALQLFHDAIQTFLKLGHKSWLSWLALDLGDLYLELGEVIRAESMFDLSSTLVAARDDSQTPIFSLVLQGKIASFRGQPEAESALRRGVKMATEANKKDEAASAALELAGLLLSAGRYAEAEDTAREWTDAPTRKTRAQAQALLGESRLRLKRDPEQILEPLNAARDLFEEVGDPFGLWSVMAAEGEQLRAMGREREASRLILRATRIEAGVRKTVPDEFLESYLSHPRRRMLLEWLGVASQPATAGASVGRPSEATLTTGMRPPPHRSARLRPAHYAKRYPDIIGDHDATLRVLDMVDKIAPLDSTVLIRGESGTGKELVAEALHRHSRRADRPFVKVNCGALVESLLLSEIFGHERGAFTGASRRKKGRFEIADGGTIFLDEIGDISQGTQVALLRVLQEKEFERVGGNTPIRVDVRIVCATNRNLEEMVQIGSFREDLYYRLKAFQIEVPPLRERASDIPILAAHFIEKISSEGECPPRILGREAEQALQQWRWPGNIRELQNVLRSVSLLADGQRLRPADFDAFVPSITAPVLGPSPVPSDAVPQPTYASSSLPVPGYPTRAAAAETSPRAARHNGNGNGNGSIASDAYEEIVNEGLSLNEYKKRVEEACIARALEQTQGNITRAAELLGMKRPRLSQLVKQYGLTG